MFKGFLKYFGGNTRAKKYIKIVSEHSVAT